MEVFNAAFRRLAMVRPHRIPDLRSCQCLFAASDYGGEHHTASYETYAILLVDLDAAGEWEMRRQAVRRRWLSDGRRLSYKGLGDRHRRAALQPLLEAADSLHGLLCTVAIDKRVGTVFERPEEGQLPVDSSALKLWPAHAIEKVLRVAHLMSLLLAGLSRADQNLLWITDQDEIAANERRLREFVKAFGIVSSHYLSHDLGHLRIGTAASDTGKRDLEDLLSISDLAAGAVADVFGSLRGHGAWPTKDISVPLQNGVPLKARTVMNWYAQSVRDLKRLVFVIDEDKEKRLRLSVMRFDTWTTA